MINNLTPNTKISLAIVIVLIGMAVSFGVQLQKISDLSERMVRVEQKIDNLLTRGISRN